MLELLRRGQIEVKGRMPWSSNGTFLVHLCLPDPEGDGLEGAAIYKPHRGERPLWDYPSGLYRREVAVYVVSEALGWGLVPETVLRDDGPFGPGSLQRFVPAHFQEHYFTMLERPELHDCLRTIGLFDLLVNNGDRKSGHCLRGEDGRIWAIDHGLCLHEEPKLRTVIWDFAGLPVPPERLDDVARLAAAPPPELGQLLEPDEIVALQARAAAVLRRPVFPVISSGRAYPWPLV
ncbi:MAG: SCO1664 family protein [Acidimicrobiales bacterium]